MKLLLDLTPTDVLRLRRYAQGDGGWATTAETLLASLRVREDGSGFSVLTAWKHIRRFAQQRDGAGDGGYQGLLRRVQTCLVKDDGTSVSEWSAIRNVVAATERPHRGEQTGFFFMSATTYA